MPARTVFLIGFMATGKSTVGRRLAERLDRPFVDLDEMVQEEAGRTVREIFAAEGEPGFRARERAALERVLGGPAAVVATGGGTPCVADSLALMQASGVVVALTAPLDEVTRRVVDPATRPLLAGPPERVRALYDSRAAVYRQAALAVATEGRAVQDVVVAAAAGIAAAEALPEELCADPVVVALGGRT
jgi:shikimate kinase